MEYFSVGKIRFSLQCRGSFCCPIQLMEEIRKSGSELSFSDNSYVAHGPAAKATILFLGVGERSGKGQGFIMQIASLSHGGEHPSDRLPPWVLTRKFQMSLLNYISVKVKTAVRSDVKSRFGIVGFCTRDGILGLWFSL